MDPLALGAAFAFGAAVLFAAVHAQGRLVGNRRAADQRVQDLHQPFEHGLQQPAEIPWRRAYTSVPVLALLFARGTRGAEMEEALQQAGMLISPGSFLLVQALLAVIGVTAALLIGGVTAVGVLLAIPFVLLGWLLPRAYLAFRTVRRLEQMDRQLVDLLGLLSSSIRAGFSVLQGLDSASSRVGPPLQVEIERVLADVRLGRPMDDALRAWSDRVPSPNVRLLVVAMIVQRSAGGNLAEVIDNLAETMRDRVELKLQVNALTAYSRLSARVVALYPFGIALLLTFMNPSVYSRLWTEPAGWALLAAALAMNVIAAMVLRKIAQVEY